MSRIGRCTLVVFFAVVLASPAYGHQSRHGRSERGRTQGEIVGGMPAQPGSWPWAAFVAVNLGEGTTDQCTGTVVAPNVVLTAAHCVAPDSGDAAYPASDFRVVTNSLDWTDTAANTISGVAQVAIEPSWNSNGFQADLALLRLASPTTAPAITLSNDSEDLPLIQPGQPADIAGWGQTDGNDPNSGSDQLQTGERTPLTPSTAATHSLDPSSTSRYATPTPPKTKTSDP